MRLWVIMLVAGGVLYWCEPKASTHSPVAGAVTSGELFKLQSECGELREKVDRQYRREHNWIAWMTVTSRYSPVSNRCLVRIVSGTGLSQDDNLYDAQTMQVLASAGSDNRTGFYDGTVRSVYGVGYGAMNKAKDFIESVMRGERELDGK